jgi:hypothetical protein
VPPFRAFRAVPAWWSPTGVGQLWRLLRVIEVDDFVVTPLKNGHVAIGRVTGGYQCRQDTASDWRHVRPVVWLQTALPRSAIQQDLLHSMGSLLTICQLRRHGAARRIAALAEIGTDPGPTAEELSSNGWVTPDELLAQAAAADDGLELTIRELLGKWGAGRRTSSAAVAIQEGRERRYSSVYLRRSYWVGDQVRNQAVAKLSALPEHVIALIEASLKGQQFVPAGAAVAIARSLPHEPGFTRTSWCRKPLSTSEPSRWDGS